MNQSCHIIEVPINRVTELETPVSEEERKLKDVRDTVIALTRKHSVETLTKSLRKLQDASRLQTIDKESLCRLLIEIRQHKYKIEILTGEMI